ncbi:MAG: hypothetical protein U1E60_00565 [Reyranellaceae bacterium]
MLRAYWREVKQGDAKLKDLVERLAELGDQIDNLEFSLGRATEPEARAQKEWKLAAQVEWIARGNGGRCRD